MPDPLVSIVMGSDSDWPTMKAAADALAEFGVPYEADVVSAHRMPEDMVRFGREAHERGVKAIAFIIPVTTFTTGLIIGLVKAKRAWK